MSYVIIKRHDKNRRVKIIPDNELVKIEFETISILKDLINENSKSISHSPTMVEVILIDKLQKSLDLFFERCDIFQIDIKEIWDAIHNYLLDFRMSRMIADFNLGNAKNTESSIAFLITIKYNNQTISELTIFIQNVWGESLKCQESSMYHNIQHL